MKTRAWNNVMRVFMEHCDDNDMELCDARVMELSDDKGHGAF